LDTGTTTEGFVDMVKISVKGLAKFMTSTPANQRKVLRDYKHPDPEGNVQRVYYKEARDAILSYHKHGHDKRWLTSKARQLADQGTLLGGRAGKRFQHNARGLRGYAHYFADRRFELLAALRLQYSAAGVRISVTPDLHVVERRLEKVIKLEFSKEEPDPTVIRIINQAMFEAATAHGLDVTSSGVLVLDVPRGHVHKGARMGSRMKRELEAACQNIATLWPGI